MSDQQTVAEIILQQLGGRRFVMTTGAKNFIGGNECLLFSIPENSTFPYNRDMGEFLGTPIKSGNGEPACGYYMARRVLSHFRLGMFSREVKTLLDGGAHLKLVADRDKKTGRPIRFDTFKPHQVLIEFDKIVCRNDRKQIRLSSNWSIETALEKAAEALRTGKHYGYDPAKDDGPISSPSVTVVIQPGEPTLFI